MHVYQEIKDFFGIDATTVDNPVFRLHYKATTIILLFLSTFVLCKQYFGVAIDCMATQEPGLKNTIDDFCWTHGTFSFQEAWEKKVGEDIPYPGVDKYKVKEAKVYHTYYQWVWFVLFLQAIIFYIPRYLWKTMEGGKVKNLVLGLNSPVLPNETKLRNQSILVKYLAFSMNNHKLYFASYVAAEMMNFVNVLGQIFLVDAFLGGKFLTYGLRVMQFTEWNRPIDYDPMVQVFPSVTTCSVRRYGVSGAVQLNTYMCLLPINVLNEKIYLFLWFWLIILAFLSGMAILYRAVIVFWPKSRFLVIRCRARNAYKDHLKSVISKCQIGDWLILNFLSKNLDPLNFHDVINGLGRHVSGLESDNVFCLDKLQ